MQLERLALKLRPRGAWEAMDLGLVLARSHWRAVWGVWLAVYVPAAVMLSIALREEAWLAAFVLWWLKPVFDRFVLHVLSRAVFGETPGVRATLGAWRELLRPGLAAWLTVHRLDLARAFVLPIWQLERQSGRAARARRTVVQKFLRSHAVWLAVVCLNFEAAVMLSADYARDLFVPGGAATPFTTAVLSGEATRLWTWANTLVYGLAVSVIEPVYVAAGFALYLDRRMRLEAWDLEVALRRMSRRLAAPAAAACFGLALALGLAVAPTPTQAASFHPTQAASFHPAQAASFHPAQAASFHPAQAASTHSAQAAPDSPKREIARVLSSPDFDTRRTIANWRYRGGKQEPARAESDGEFWLRVGRLISQVMQFVAWAALAVLVIALAWQARRLFARTGPPRPPPPAAARARLSARVAPAPLPADVAAEAEALAARGALREALALLYRGALAALAARYGVAVAPSDTEADSLRLAQGALAEPARGYFTLLVEHWRRAAYAAAPAAREQIVQLCAGWRTYFGAPRA